VCARHRQETDAVSIDVVEAQARAALPLLEQTSDHAGLVYVWTSLSEVANHRGHWKERGEALERAVYHARLAARQPKSSASGATGALSPEPLQELLRKLGSAYLQGPERADELLREFDRLLPGGSYPGHLLNHACLLAMLDRQAEAWVVALDASDRLRELTGDHGAEYCLAEIATLAGDHEAAATYSRTYYEWVEEHHFTGILSTWAPTLGRSLCALRRYEEAEPLAQQGRALGDAQDVATQALWRQVQALVHARRGQHAESERLAREAVAIVEQTDGLNMQGDALCDLAEVLAAAGRADEAAAALAQASERYERKHNLAMTRQVRERLSEPQPA
jgi:tetratricopeptide (TPR) repeat protein